MSATIGRGVLGLTVQCARCHNQKVGPIPQKDYYKMQAWLYGYVETDFPLTSRGEAEAYEKKLADMEARIEPLKREIRALEEPYRLKLAQEKYKKFPANVQRAIAIPEDKRTPGGTLLANQIIRTTSVGSDEIDRILPPEELARKKSLNDEIRQLDKERPKPIPMAAGVTEGGYRFAPDGAGDEATPDKCVKRQAIEGSHLHRGPGRTPPPPAYLFIRWQT